MLEKRKRSYGIEGLDEFQIGLVDDKGKVLFISLTHVTD